MSKDSSKGEAGVYPHPDKVGPLNGNVEPEASTKAVEIKTDLASPDDHAKALSAVKTITRTARVNNEPETFQLYHWQHSAAAALHGWANHEHHEAKPMQLSREDYNAALLAATKPVTRLLGADGKPGEITDSHEAAAKGLPTITDYEPHAPALSIHKDKA